jgi:cell division protein FtsL
MIAHKNAIRRITGADGERMPLWPIALLLTVATVWGLIHVWVRLQLIAVGYEISRQHEIQHQLTELSQRLSLELRTRMDLGSIEKLARDRLKMESPDAQKLRRLPVPR